MRDDAASTEELSPNQNADSPPREGERIEGVVTALAPGFFAVAAGGTTYLCTARGRLRKPPRPAPVSPAAMRRGAIQQAKSTARQASPSPEPNEADARPVRIAPGDRVLITRISDTEGVIEEVLPRRTALARARGERGTEQVMLANADQSVLVFATQEPEPHFGLLDRYLVLCEHAGVAPVICLNKVDLGIPLDVAEHVAQYTSLGYPVLFTSAATGDGIASLRERLTGKLSLLTGESGVGKSSLTNLLVPGAQQRIGEISAATHLGRHTTTGVHLIPLPEGGWLADSAGIRELSLWNVPSEELARCFVELRPFVDRCEYEDCTHSMDEEGCALQEAFTSGAISPRRFASFERLLEEARAEEGPAWAKR